VKLEKTEPQVKCRITFESGLKVAPIDFPWNFELTELLFNFLHKSFAETISKLNVKLMRWCRTVQQSLLSFFRFLTSVSFRSVNFEYRNWIHRKRFIKKGQKRAKATELVNKNRKQFECKSATNLSKRRQLSSAIRKFTSPPRSQPELGFKH
jgi:hypothetical protein